MWKLDACFTNLNTVSMLFSQAHKTNNNINRPYKYKKYIILCKIVVYAVLNYYPAILKNRILLRLCNIKKCDLVVSWIKINCAEIS